MCTRGGSGDGPTCPRGHHTHRAAAAAGEGTIRRGAAVRPTPRIPPRAGQRRPILVIAVVRDDSAWALATTGLTGPDPYEATASLLAWAAIHAATPDTDLRPGVHGPAAAFGLDTLTLGAESGLHEA
jgi:short subunit dehydrogenase-like uncharacterized protein